ncbi:fumarylacetoacetate hydrolase family protein [Marivita hallyeonensis]|uniref:2-keto-4-pentenoate hydratase/2-oxohepta-3-ene-1,7-dioic acid hydratase (Catechol pathway) n=1 Tax=Marivita hallyeonensis TaxID=996342 RepID=A0A1M5XN10_9RHOB|nr:fumarylacetoacetate hydrolase family protein [Marivita hallyeonensis]SHI01217.1 2-keto-4-pentenoate hydratase/2-oxohepta-3-ene-1,7-dioic acid hydratase (catechol pathway) [Marivita hallyeonensis]
MKLLRYGPAGQEKPGLLDADGVMRDLSAHVDDVAHDTLDPAKLTELASLPTIDLPEVPADTRLGPCIAGVGKFICIGLNYSDHAAESGMAVPEEPVIFMKATSAITGPNDPIIKPRGATKLDWEIELAIVIGKTARYVDQDAALDHVAGYCIAHDVSERSFQIERAGQWTKGKSADSFGPIGPWLVTPDTLGPVDDLVMELTVNGAAMQKGSTKTMVFGVAEIVSHLSQFMSLHPGDVIATGTPPGVGMGMKPPQFLDVGDVVELSIAGLGTQRQTVVAVD